MTKLNNKLVPNILLLKIDNRYDNGETIVNMFDEGGYDTLDEEEELERLNILPEVIVDGYAPLRLTTYYPFVSEYPFTGHSELDIPIDRNTWENYTGNLLLTTNDRISPYLTIDKNSRADDYNLITNNCADATLNYLNKAFGTNESPNLFTTPGDVRDYAINQLHGKVIDNNDGSDTVLIPRNANNARKLSTTALDMYADGDLLGTATMSYKGPFNYTRPYVNRKSEGGELSKPLEWDKLSIRDRAAYIRMGVSNGFKDIDSIRQIYDEYRNGGYLYKDGGNKESNTSRYAPSQYIRDRISLWEGNAIHRDTIDPLSGKLVKKNRSFEEEANAFINALPEGIRDRVLSNQALADHLYSYSYNVGAGNFKNRVVPALVDYYNGKGNINTVANSMWASGDAKLKGLRNRRTIEREGVKKALLKQIENNLLQQGKLLLNVEIPDATRVDNTNTMILLYFDSLIPNSTQALQNVITINREIPEVIIAPQSRKKQILSDNDVILLDYIDNIPTLMIPMLSIPTATLLLKLQNYSNKTLLLKDLEDSIIRNNLLDIQNSDKLRRDAEDLRFYRNMSALRGNEFDDGGYTKTYIDGRGKEVTFHRFPNETDEQYETRYAERAAIRERNAATNKARYEGRRAVNEAGTVRLNRAINTVTNAMEEQSKSTPFTGQEIHQATEEQRQEELDKWREYKKGINATITAAELGLSGASLLGAYANYKNWATAANATKRGIANLLQKAQLPMQVGGTLIDAYQTYDALQNNDNFNANYNGISAGLGVAGSVGASDMFLNSRLHSPKIDRVLDAMGVIQNSGDFIKFGYDSMFGNKKAKGGPKPVTTGGTGYIPNNYGQGAIDYIRRKLYDNILPWGYNDILQRVYNAVVKNKKEEDETRDRAIRDNLFATYLQIPNSERHTIEGGKVTLTDASYKPKGAVKGKPTYKFSKLTSPAEYGILAYAGQVPGSLNIEGGDYLPIGKNRVVYPNDINAFSELEGLGQFTVGRGYDKKGEYISYYDSWDLGDTNSPYKDMSLGIGRPFNIYDRIYLDDYYGVKEPTHATYLPEVIVTGKKKKAFGGNLFPKGGQMIKVNPMNPIEYMHLRFPVTELLDVHPLFDSEFTPRDIGDFGDIEYMLARYDNLPYYNNYSKPDSLKGKSVIVYNDRLGEGTNEAIALDALSHGLRELDNIWRELYIPTLLSAFREDANYFADLEGIPLEYRQEYIDGFIDGKIRDMVVKDSLRRLLNYQPKQSLILEYRSMTPELLNALTEAYSYIFPTLLNEVVVNGKRK